MTKLFGETVGNIFGIIEGIVITVATGGVGTPLYAAAMIADRTVEAFAGTLVNGGSFGDALIAGLKAASGVPTSLAELKEMGIDAAASFLSAAGADKVGDVFHGTAKFGESAGSIAKGAAKELGRAAAHGAVQGGVEMLRGGEFIHGFAAGSSASLVSHGLDKAGISGIGNLASSQIVAGTVSKLSGGKFANGAQAAAAIYTYNLKLHGGISYNEPDPTQPIETAASVIGYGEAGADVATAGWKAPRLGLGLKVIGGFLSGGQALAQAATGNAVGAWDTIGKYASGYLGGELGVAGAVLLGVNPVGGAIAGFAGSVVLPALVTVGPIHSQYSRPSSAPKINGAD